MSETEFASHEWWARYKETVNSDREMQVRGHDRFDENFCLRIGEESFLVEVSEGQVDSVVPNPDLNDDWAIGVEGSREAWEEFVQEHPPAHNNEIIASDYRTAVKGEGGHLRLTGSNETFFQNLRPFQRALDLLRETHNA